MYHPTISLISGKHPKTGKSGYAHYGAALARQLVALGSDVHIFCVGQTSSVTKTPIGIIHVVKVPFIRIIAGREMAALVPASVLIAQAINKLDHAEIIWGIGPWTLAGLLVKKNQPSVQLFADYFTTIKHEYHTPIFSLLERSILTKSDRIITHYRSTEKILQNEFKLDRKKFYQMPYAI